MRVHYKQCLLYIIEQIANKLGLDKVGFFIFFIIIFSYKLLTWWRSANFAPSPQKNAYVSPSYWALLLKSMRLCKFYSVL